MLPMISCPASNLKAKGRQMKKVAVGILAALVVIGSNAIAATIEFFEYSNFLQSVGPPSIITFDNFAKGTTLSGSELPGVSIIARRVVVVNPQDFAPGLVVGGQNVNSQPNGISASLPYNGSRITFDNGDDNFDFILSTPSNSAGIWVGNVGASNNDPTTSTTITFFNSLGLPIASEAITQGHTGQIGIGANNRLFYGIRTDDSIASFTIRNAAGDGDGILIDDVQIAPVPIPATFWLFGCGLTALGILGRYKPSPKIHEA